jgi:hypothetical protein
MEAYTVLQQHYRVVVLVTLLFCGEAATENSSKPLLIFMYDLSPAGGRS